MVFNDSVFFFHTPSDIVNPAHLGECFVVVVSGNDFTSKVRVVAMTDDDSMTWVATGEAYEVFTDSLKANGNSLSELNALPVA